MFSTAAALLTALLTVVGLVPATNTRPPSGGSVMVTPETVSLHAGETQQLTVVVTDRHGRPATSKTVRWSTSAESVATVSSAGLVRAVAPGTALIIASSRDATDTSVVTVTPAGPANQLPTVTITEPTAGTTFGSGAMISFAASATDPEDGDLTSTIAWSVGELSLGTGGLMTTSSLTPGPNTVAASVTDAGGATVTETVTITVLPPNQGPTVSITGPGDGAQIYSTQAFDVAATAQDPEDGDLSANVAWSIASAEGTSSAGTGGTITVGPLALGSYTVEASVTDSGGLTSTDEINLDVIQEPIDVSVTTDGDPNESAAIGFTATVTGAVTGVVIDQLDDLATWTLSSEGGTPVDAGTGAIVEVGPLAPGSYSMTATVVPGGTLSPASGQVTFTVADCVVSPSLRPESGDYIPQYLQLSATHSTDSCGRPLKFFWECQSDTSPYCADFNVAANADGNTNQTPLVPLRTFDQMVILLIVCAVDPANSDPRGECAPRIVKVYEGAVV